MSVSETPAHKPIRTYGRIHGRITRGQKRGLANWGEKYLIPFHGQCLFQIDYFPHQRDLVLDLGCGMSDALIEIARQQSTRNFIGIDVYEPGIARGCALAGELALDNVRLIHHDMNAVLRTGIVAMSVAEIYILFPDPWPKRRHHKRRLVQTRFVHLLRRALVDGGRLHLATDVVEYARHIQDLFEKRGDFERLDSKPADNVIIPHTKFEKRGMGAGNPITHFLYRAI